MKDGEPTSGGPEKRDGIRAAVYDAAARVAAAEHVPRGKVVSQFPGDG